MTRRPLAIEPRSVEEAIATLVEYGDEAKLVAGSTAITIMLRQRLIDPGVLVFLHNIPNLHEITGDAEMVMIDGLVTHGEVAANPIVRSDIPSLAHIFGVVGNVRVRSAATVGGVLAEADYASDPPCGLLALDAAVEVQGVSGPRSIPIDKFFLGFYETSLKPDEVITRVRVPLPVAGSVAVYEKFKTRSSEDRPCVGVFVVLRLDGAGQCTDLRVAVGAASETPERFRDVEEFALGRPLDEALASEIADAYSTRIDTLHDMRGSAWYRSEMIRVWVRRTILRAGGTASA